MAVVGANGSGKSTLGAAAGRARPAGRRGARRRSCGHDLLDDEGRMAVRRDVGVLFQNPDNQLVGERPSKKTSRSAWRTSACRRRDRAARVDEMLDAVRARRAAPARAAPAVGRPAPAHGAGRRAGRAAPRAGARRAHRDARPGRARRGAGRACAARPTSGLTVVCVTQEMDEVLLRRPGRGAGGRPRGLRRAAPAASSPTPSWCAQLVARPAAGRRDRPRRCSSAAALARAAAARSTSSWRRCDGGA